MPPRNDPATTAALYELFSATVALTHRATAAAQQLHGQGEATAGRRGVLLSLQRLGPSTVPQLARMRPVSRQHIQVLVNSLLHDGLVELTDNPAHRRSRLVGLTERGRELLAHMRAREDHVFQRLELPADAHRLRAAAQLLRRLAELVASQAFTRLAAAQQPAAARSTARKPAGQSKRTRSPRRSRS